ncbi:hypothetical protein BG004_005909 [Podila humilis]|nr:hypothetical protein BG004_005909 [Podila humilis]
MSSPVSITDIPLIVETIIHHLPQEALHSCRRVNHQWSTLCNSSFWRTVQLRASTKLNPAGLATLQKYKTHVRCLKIASHHIPKAGPIGFTDLQDLIVYDETFFNHITFPAISAVDIFYLIGTNTRLDSLTFDLHGHHYDEDPMFLQILFFQLASHKHLRKLTWYVPTEQDGQEFAKNMLLCCGQSETLQEMTVVRRGDEDRLAELLSVQPRMVSQYGSHALDLSEDEESDWSTLPPLRKLQVCHSFALFYPLILKYCPNLQQVGFEFCGPVTQYQCTILDTLVAKYGDLTFLDLGKQHYISQHPRYLKQFRRLERVHLGAYKASDFKLCVNALAKSPSRENLEFLGVNDMLEPNIFLYALEALPKLKVFENGYLRVVISATSVEGQEFLPGFGKPTLAQDWDPTFYRRLYGNVVEWWEQWDKAVVILGRLMEEWREAPSATKAGRTIAFKFMLPLYPFMTKDMAIDYDGGYGRWKGDGRRQRELDYQDAFWMFEQETGGF